MEDHCSKIAAKIGARRQGMSNLELKEQAVSFVSPERAESNNE